jgi:AraC family transcriptional regulator
MNTVDKALWFIETHFQDELTLDEVAQAAGLSRFHLSRVFAYSTGYPVIRYVRGRRLTVAARALATGAPDILAVALDSGYGSHEAFTRAFREQFGLTPELLRARGHLDDIELTEPIRMDETQLTQLEPPRLEDLQPLLIAGLSEPCNEQTTANIPAQWQRFVLHLGHIPGQLGETTYGVIYNTGDAGNMEYLCGVEVADLSRVPAGLNGLRIPEQRYLVFQHRDHVSTIRRTWVTIWSKWFPESEYRPADGPAFERYGSQFNPHNGAGGFELWVPIKV